MTRTNVQAARMTAKTKTPPMTQLNRIVSVFGRKTRNTLTATQAERDYGIKNLRARISELRAQITASGSGVQIDATSRTTHGVTETVYSLRRS